MDKTRANKKRKTNEAIITYEESQKAAELESFLFSKDDAAVDLLGAENQSKDDEFSSLTDLVRGAGLEAVAADRNTDLLIFEDRAGVPAAAAHDAERAGDPSTRLPVWEDPDDELVEVNVASRNRLRKLRETEDETVLTGKDYEKRLRQQHSKLNPHTSWASVTKAKRRAAEGGQEEGEEATAALLQTAGGLLGKGSALPPGLLETTRLKDANQAEPCGSVVRSVEFHSNGQLLLVAGLDKRLRFFNVDGLDNPKVQSVFLADMPVHRAAFAGGGTQVVASGRRKFFYHLDLGAGKVERVAGLFGREEKSLETFVASQDTERPVVAFFGNEGHIPLVSLNSRQCVGSLKMNGTVRSGAFTADGTELLTSGGDGMVYVWDLRMQRCLQRYLDEGCLSGTSLACSPTGGLFASGSSSGVVNVYQRPAQTGTLPVGGPLPAVAARPLKTFMNLTTTIDSLAFNADSQILAMASRMKRDSLRLVHLPTCTVFSNWPTSRSPLHYVHSLAFSPGGGYLAIGNAKGRVLLYRLHHYPSA